MIKVIIIGAGNLAFHLLKTFEKNTEIEIIQTLNRSKKEHKSNIPFTTDYSKIKDADIYIIAVSDDAIPDVSQKLIHKKGLVVHTSGSVPMAVLSKNHNHGVFYPLQTFSKETEVDFSSVPIGVEAKNKTDLELLKNLGNAVSKNVQEISSKQRKSLHLSAVLVNNFTNHLYHLGKVMCKENKVSFELLKPLISETVKKLDTTSPFDAQTGPAKRGDKSTIKIHLNQIKDENLKKIYTTLSQSISNTYGEKL
ncbi:MAG: hypothetical protein COA50_11445 [Flavobacteriaceae bacterium]|nr:MAG: hypothetical protein COA50_11445 [Flavobacteriaceae bacterium]